MSTPKPIELTAIAADDYAGRNAPQAYVVVGGLPPATDEVAGGVLQAGLIGDVTTANGSDAATTQALANALKTKLNAVLAALREAGVIAES